MPLVTTLQDFLKALLGEPKKTANFPEAAIEIAQFEDVEKAAKGYVEQTFRPLPLTLIFGSWVVEGTWKRAMG